MLDKNPSLIQRASKTQAENPPLVLIHDGGGTIFGYYALGSLNRDVYAISNPKFDSDAHWEGGMDQMARTYIQLLEKADIKQPFVLGGWSLGALISIRIAHILAQTESSKLSVLGLLMIDASFHIPWSKNKEVSRVQFPGVPDGVRKCLEACAGLLDTWELPAWKPIPSYKRRVYLDQSKPRSVPPKYTYHQMTDNSASMQPLEPDVVPYFLANMPGNSKYLIEPPSISSLLSSKGITSKTNGVSYTNGTSKTNGVVHANNTPKTNGVAQTNGTEKAKGIHTNGSSHTNGNSLMNGVSHTNGVHTNGTSHTNGISKLNGVSETNGASLPLPLGPPSAVLLRGTQRVSNATDNLPARVDLFRDKTLLGWEYHKSEFITAVIDVEGASHYTMFELDGIDKLTEKINQALSLLGV